MPQRPRSHTLETTSRNRLHDAFEQRGWIVWDLHPDYGEDLLVRIFKEGATTPYSFFVQAKATDHIERYMQKGGKHLRFPVDTEHFEQWNQFWEPVIFTVWDARADITYWETIQNYFEYQDNTTVSGKNLRVDIPTDNILNEEGIRRIVARTMNRFARFHEEREGASILIRLLEKALDAKIHYQPQGGLLVINRSGEDPQVITFGKLAQQTPQEFDLTEGETVEELTVRLIKHHNALINRVLEEYNRTGRIILRNDEGVIIETYKSYGDWIRHLERKNELDR